MTSVLESGSIEVAPLWGQALRVLVTRADKTAFACTAVPADGRWLVTDCLPERQARDTAANLLSVCDYLVSERAAPATIVIAPVFLDDELVAGGAQLQGRIVPMWLALDDDILQMHTRPPTGAYELRPLASTADALAALSAEPYVDSDRRVWHEVLSEEYGPLIDGACLQIAEAETVHAAIAITEYQGMPLAAHMVTAAGDRGKGLGRAAMVAALRGLRAAGYVDCRLNVAEENRVARRLYRSLGFVQHRPTLRVSELDRVQVDDVR
jgi:GNAT superfamily N-acetyltransferase